jgi:hypothetical protein
MIFSYFYERSLVSGGISPRDWHRRALAMEDAKGTEAEENGEYDIFPLTMPGENYRGKKLIVGRGKRLWPI